MDDFTPSVTKTKNAFASAASAKLPLPPSGTDSAHMNELYSDEFLAQLSKGMESMLMQQPGNNDDASVDSLPSSALLGGSSGIGGGGLETAEPAKLKEMHNDFKEFLRGLELEAVGSSNSDKNQANEGVVEEGAATATINITSEGSSRSFQSKITSTLNKLKDSDGLVNVSNLYFNFIRLSKSLFIYCI